MVFARLRTQLQLLFAVSGFAALTWELVWQHHLAFALGVSAFATAVTVATTMGGMACGAIIGARLADGRFRDRPWVALAIFELVIGVWGLLLPVATDAVAWLDVRVYALGPGLAPAVQVAACVACLTPPTLAMGATIAAMRELSARANLPMHTAYGLNTVGAAVGIVVEAFVVVPSLGVQGARGVAALVNLLVAATCLSFARRTEAPIVEARRGAAPVVEHGGSLGPRTWLVALLTGAATFVLELAWFRSLKAAFQSTTDSLAVMLFAFLLAIAVGAAIARGLRGRRAAQGWLLVIGSLVCVASNALVDRADLFSSPLHSYWGTVGLRLGLAVAIMGPPVALISCVLPAFLDDSRDVRAVARIYAWNTVGGIMGALGCAWGLLPLLGPFRAGVVGAGLAAAAGLTHLRGRLVLPSTIGCAVALFAAMRLGSGTGLVRVQALGLEDLIPIRTMHGPDATVVVARDAQQHKQLVIDGFQTTGESEQGHYMRWMGILPMAAHADPKRSLVICFGTGQTANAVRRQAPALLDIVELSPAVIMLAPEFESNERVLDDPRVHVHVMDGRAWLRRTKQTYDVITLEPMDPHFAGANALYSREFYEAASSRLSDDGVVAQWVPLHLLPPTEVASVVRTMREVFPDAFLWIDPVDRTGILVGRRGSSGSLAALPHLDRSGQLAGFDPAWVRAGIVLDAAGVARLSEAGDLITDDNQLLSYGASKRDLWRIGSNEANHRLNMELLARLRH